MGGAKTACAFAPKIMPPMGAGAGAGGRSPMGGARCAVFSPMPNGEKKFFQKLHFYVDKHSNLAVIYRCPDERGAHLVN